MKWTIVPLVLLAGGCTAYNEAQIRLLEQAQRGISLCREAQRGRSQLVEQLQLLQRQRVDEAFDRDVQENGMLSADWVIEHRRAYAAAVDALARQRYASIEAEAAAERNFDAVEQALNRMRWMQAVQLKLVSWEGGPGLGLPEDRGE